VEGPFAKNAQFVSMLQAATGRPVALSFSATGTSIGAAMLADPNAATEGVVPADPVEALEALKRYAQDWRTAIQGFSG
jgi:sugar (pentulose or hexulose) kinase